MPDASYTLDGKKVYVAGSGGMVGGAIMRRLEQENCNAFGSTRADVDLTRQTEVEEWFDKTRPEAVFLAAAKVGGILANNNAPADFLYDNMMIEANIIHAAHQTGVEKLLFLGSSCIYPKYAEQPIPESELMQGPLEPTNEAYAIAKIAGIRLCQYYRRQHQKNFISAMPTNLYGPGDNYDLISSHVLPALIRKVEEARATNASAVTIWGSGTPLREFMHVDDCADALVFLMKHYSDHDHVNVGTGQEVSIQTLAQLICDTAGYSGDILLDTSKPDGTPRKILNSSRLNAMGWVPAIPLEKGLAETLALFRKIYR